MNGKDDMTIRAAALVSKELEVYYEKTTTFKSTIEQTHMTKTNRQVIQRKHAKGGSGTEKTTRMAEEIVNTLRSTMAMPEVLAGVTVAKLEYLITSRRQEELLKMVEHSVAKRVECDFDICVVLRPAYSTWAVRFYSQDGTESTPGYTVAVAREVAEPTLNPYRFTMALGFSKALAQAVTEAQAIALLRMLSQNLSCASHLARLVKGLLLSLQLEAAEKAGTTPTIQANQRARYRGIATNVLEDGLTHGQEIDAAGVFDKTYIKSVTPTDRYYNSVLIAMTASVPVLLMSDNAGAPVPLRGEQVQMAAEASTCVIVGDSMNGAANINDLPFDAQYVRAAVRQYADSVGKLDLIELAEQVAELMHMNDGRINVSLPEYSRVWDLYYRAWDTSRPGQGVIDPPTYEMRLCRGRIAVDSASLMVAELAATAIAPNGLAVNRDLMAGIVNEISGSRSYRYPLYNFFSTEYFSNQFSRLFCVTDPMAGNFAQHAIRCVEDGPLPLAYTFVGSGYIESGFIDFMYRGYYVGQATHDCAKPNRGRAAFIAALLGDLGAGRVPHSTAPMALVPSAQFSGAAQSYVIKGVLCVTFTGVGIRMLPITRLRNFKDEAELAGEPAYAEIDIELEDEDPDDFDDALIRPDEADDIDDVEWVDGATFEYAASMFDLGESGRSTDGASDTHSEHGDALPDDFLPKTAAEYARYHAERGAELAREAEEKLNAKYQGLGDSIDRAEEDMKKAANQVRGSSSGVSPLSAVAGMFGGKDESERDEERRRESDELRQSLFYGVRSAVESSYAVEAESLAKDAQAGKKKKRGGAVSSKARDDRKKDDLKQRILDAQSREEERERDRLANMKAEGNPWVNVPARVKKPKDPINLDQVGQMIRPRLQRLSTSTQPSSPADVKTIIEQLNRAITQMMNSSVDMCDVRPEEFDKAVSLFENKGWDVRPLRINKKIFAAFLSCVQNNSSYHEEILRLLNELCTYFEGRDATENRKRLIQLREALDWAEGGALNMWGDLLGVLFRMFNVKVEGVKISDAPPRSTGKK
jgi:hypothetical protein